MYSIHEAGEQLAAAGLQRAVLVQAAPTLAETEYLLSLAAKTTRVAGVVGWLPLTGALETLQQITTLRSLPGGETLVGVRPMLQDIEDDAYLIRPEVVESLAVLQGVERPLAFDALVHPRHLPVLLEFMQSAQRFDRPLTVVLDHLAKPELNLGAQWGGWRAWKSALIQLARYPNAVCKLSGLPAQAGASVESETFRPFIEVALDCFGSERLLWGSDWPIVALCSSMGAWLEAVEHCIARLSPIERDAILGANAQRVYALRPMELG